MKYTSFCLYILRKIIWKSLKKSTLSLTSMRYPKIGHFDHFGQALKTEQGTLKNIWQRSNSGKASLPATRVKVVCCRDTPRCRKPTGATCVALKKTPRRVISWSRNRVEPVRENFIVRSIPHSCNCWDLFWHALAMNMHGLPPVGPC